MSSLTSTLLILTVLVILLPAQTYAFGAGDIPDFAYLNDKAFRHGDIENILTNLVKSAGAAGAGGGLLGFAQSVMSSASGGAKFSKSDVKKVYFGNWLRDYSQAMDIAGLSKLSADSLVLVVSVLGFMEFGFATNEFQVTAERLGVYLPTEHIDNPKGYAAKEGDARQYHPKLRPPVNPRELEIDQRTGMKNYMATENQGWDTSTALVRRVFRSCIEYGRRAQGKEGPELFEAYRLLGTGLHTMEDLLAHSNWCEIALRKMGHQNVFCHVGDSVYVNTPNGSRVPPLVTGTFGGADFLHSLMGEATDKLSQASVTDLANKMQSGGDGNSSLDTLKTIIGQLPLGGGGGSGDKMSQAENLQAKAKAYHLDPNNIAPPEVRQQLLDILTWHDDVYRDILDKIEMIPGLSDLMDNLTNALNAYIYTLVAPWMTPILQQVTGVLGEGSKAVIDSDDQFAVFNDSRASDPSHSLLSKDHFGLILNEPAGKVAQIVVEHSVNLIVGAWADERQDPNQVINQILEAFHHPYYASGRSQIQAQMFQAMERWIGGLGRDEAAQTLQALTKESVRNGKNKRLGSEGQDQMEPGYGACDHGSSQSHKQSSSGGYSGQQQYGGSAGRPTQETYGRADNAHSSGYGGQQYGDGGRRTQDTYGQDDNSHSSGYGGEQQYGGRRTQETYGRGDSTHSSGYGGEQQYGGHRTQDTYGQNDDTRPSGYGGEQRHSGRYTQETYGRSEETGYEDRQSSYGSGGRRTEDNGQDSYRNTGREDKYYGSETASYGERQSGGYQQEARYGSTQNDQPEYGSHRQSGYDSRRNEQLSYATPSDSYNRTEERSSYSETQDEDGGYGRGHQTSSYSTRQDEYSRGGDEGQTYSSQRGGGYRTSQDDEQPSGYGTQDDSSYNQSSTYEQVRYEESREEYGGEERESNYQESQETFGAERLNLDEGEGQEYNDTDYSRRDEYSSGY